MLDSYVFINIVYNTNCRIKRLGKSKANSVHHAVCAVINTAYGHVLIEPECALNGGICNYFLNKLCGCGCNVVILTVGDCCLSNSLCLVNDVVNHKGKSVVLNLFNGGLIVEVVNCAYNCLKGSGLFLTVPDCICKILYGVGNNDLFGSSYEVLTEVCTDCNVSVNAVSRKEYVENCLNGAFNSNACKCVNCLKCCLVYLVQGCILEYYLGKNGGIRNSRFVNCHYGVNHLCVERNSLKSICHSINNVMERDIRKSDIRELNGLKEGSVRKSDIVYFVKCNANCINNLDDAADVSLCLCGVEYNA